MTMISRNGMTAEKSKLEFAFEQGFVSASSSLEHLVKDKILYNNFQNECCDLDESTLDNDAYHRHNQSTKLLVTTEIFGEVTGKSYLFLSDHEFNQLTTNIPESSDPSVNYKEEFLKELDNIISAAVITELANKLQKRMYGNVPMLVGRVNSKVEDTIYDDFIDQSSRVYVNAILFSFKNSPDIAPLFIWVMNENE